MERVAVDLDSEVALLQDGGSIYIEDSSQFVNVRKVPSESRMFQMFLESSRRVWNVLATPYCTLLGIQVNPARLDPMPT